MSIPVVLLIHGVNSRGEWHDRTTRECYGVFECVSIKYRYYHGLFGALKVYAWPTALLLVAIVLTLLLSDDTKIYLAVILCVLIANTLVTLQAEYAWSNGKARFFVPVLYSTLGGAAAFLKGHSRIAWMVAAVAATSSYLDLREYGHPHVSARVAGIASMAVLAGAAGGTYWLLDQPSVLPLWVTFVTLLVLMVVEPWIRQALAFSFVRNSIKEVRERDPFHPFPHVVAHSLGTYLTGHILNEEERPLLGRVIFTGCVLDRKFPWYKNVGPEAQQKFWAVKNYVGGIDVVPVFTGSLRTVWVLLTSPARIPGIIRGTEFIGNLLHWRPLGWAGQRGFRDREPVVHSLPADTMCPMCVPGGNSAAVHNVRARFAGHSTINGDADYQCFQWLPFLWADSPVKFDYWKALCTLGHQAATALQGQIRGGVLTSEQIVNQNALADAEHRLLSGPWYWPLNGNWLSQGGLVAGRPLRAYVEEIVDGFDTRPNVSVDVLLRRVPVIIFQKFAVALAERKSSTPRANIMALLEPRKVLVAAVCDAINMEPHGDAP